LSVIAVLGACAVVWAIINLPVEKINAGLIALSIVTVFFSSYLKIQLPRTKIHLNVSDALIILSLLIYGGEVAVLLAALESLLKTLNFRRQGTFIKNRTILLNVAVAVVSAFTTASVVYLVFSTPSQILIGGSGAEFIALLTAMAFSQFIVNSIFAATFIALKSDKTIWQVWNEYCLNALAMHGVSALLAGLSVKALTGIDMFLFAVGIGFSALVYITYRHYITDVKTTAAKAEQSERERAEQAEQHISELQHHIAEQERISDALRESKERFRRAAFHDDLTDLPNRNQFIEK
jgi:hypothetical protein